MHLTYGDLMSIFPNRAGVQNEELIFRLIATSSKLIQGKGLYIPIEEEIPDLKQALENGAVAAVWKAGEKLPAFTPNHFPILFTNDLLKGLEDMMNVYVNKLQQTDGEQLTETKLMFSNKDEIQTKRMKKIIGSRFDSFSFIQQQGCDEE
ncbi:hypothetical protein [Cytobacillus purgationiresistens]|uniref:UDP-N-acetylmuramyl pentapeptide synthase n=1 Tax=Cytobacillus purgationiresistens TaxID=863449 RepID=A0ABU0AHR1_9BACI|nr:hypothetical protein [Cytobacillus purgationiresistens]MDQ0270337.1 UDP-N-acetylmuramyl pentapeptide synthase [Cytobacillus purgationiresistens]